MIEPGEIKTLARQSAVIITGALLFGLAFNLVHPRGYVLVSRKSLERKNIVEIGIDEGKIKHDHASAMFVDTRDGDDYITTRIKGSINIPAYPESLALVKIREHYRALASPLELVLYCDEGCDSSKRVAEMIIERGYSRKIFVMKHGVSSWESQGYPVESGR